MFRAAVFSIHRDMDAVRLVAPKSLEKKLQRGQISQAKN
jgi:hypothetical protein